jgi:hypothetical protein
MRDYTEKQKQIIKVLYPEKYIELFGQAEQQEEPQPEPEPETKTDEPVE